jgi:hypothetical protein
MPLVLARVDIVMFCLNCALADPLYDQLTLQISLSGEDGQGFEII